MRILVAYDGSVCGDGALYDLASSGIPPDAEILVLSVANPFPRFQPALGPGGDWSPRAPEPDRSEAEASLAESRILAERAARYLAAGFPGWRIRIRAVPGLPAERILSQAESWKPDLLVLGTHGRSALGRMLLGSVIQKVLLHCRRPVRIARARIGADAAAPRLLLAMDGSPSAFAALDSIAARNWPAGTQARLLAVVDARSAMDGLLLADAGESWIGSRLLEAETRLSAARLAVSTELRSGDPRRVILHEAGTWQAQCIFMGCRGLNPFQRFLLGSVSTAVAFHAPCSVEVFRAGKGRGAGEGEAKAAKSRAGNQGTLNMVRNRRKRPAPKSNSIRHR